MIFGRLIFAWIYFPGCNFYYISRGIVFTDREISIVWRGLIFAVVRYVIFVPSVIIAWEDVLTASVSFALISNSKY